MLLLDLMLVFISLLIRVYFLSVGVGLLVEPRELESLFAVVCLIVIVFVPRTLLLVHFVTRFLGHEL